MIGWESLFRVIEKHGLDYAPTLTESSNMGEHELDFSQPNVDSSNRELITIEQSTTTLISSKKFH